MATIQLSFKAYLVRWLAATQRLVPDENTTEGIETLLQASVHGALEGCNGDGACGSSWTMGAFDGKMGVGQQLAALEVTQGQLADGRGLPGKIKGRRRSVLREFVA